MPKTKRAYLIRLDSVTVARLGGWRARQNEERLLVGPGYQELDLVFCHPDGRPCEPNRFSREFSVVLLLLAQGDLHPRDAADAE